jgi:hypothetical protein
MCYGPAVAWAVFALLKYGPSRGYWPVLGLAFFVGVGILGLTAVFIRVLPRDNRASRLQAVRGVAPGLVG